MACWPTSTISAWPSGAGARLDLDALPIAPGVATVAMAHGRSARDLALGGGEDYELLFTVPGALTAGIVAELLQATGVPATPIGTIVAGTPEIQDSNGQPLAIVAVVGIIYATRCPVINEMRPQVATPFDMIGSEVRALSDRVVDLEHMSRNYSKTPFHCSSPGIGVARFRCFKAPPTSRPSRSTVRRCNSCAAGLQPVNICVRLWRCNTRRRSSRN